MTRDGDAQGGADIRPPAPLQIVDGRTAPAVGRVVVVDDEPLMRHALRRSLEAIGCIVVEAADGDAGLDAAADPRVDVVISDVVMPGRSGLDVCRELRAAAVTRLLPVILLTGNTSREVKLEALAAGATDFLGKPFDRLELEARVRNLVGFRRMTRDLDDAESVVFSIARAVEARDGGTGEHCDRLANAGEAFGRFLGLDDGDCVALRRGGFLHDIGKLAIPDAVLLKRGPLTPDEWEVMRTHAEVGARICGSMRSLQRVIPIIRHHHERWDGTGYPDRLSGVGIPYLARVFHVLDVFDALTSDRSYRSAMSAQEALETVHQEVERGWMDPEIVAAFERFLEAPGSASEPPGSAEFRDPRA